ncbi:MAG: L,D-transpeptidase [Spirulinaceae cyanobacterium]
MMKPLGLSLGLLLTAGMSLSGRPAVAVDPSPTGTITLPIAAAEIPPLGAAETFLPRFEQQLILDLSDRRVYLYVNDEQVASYPVAVGRDGWETPTGEFEVFQRVANPVWQHPFTQEIVPPGPENPLGARWLGFWSDGTNAIGFHGTPDENLIGQAVSHGCVRMRNADIEQLFEQVEVGTPVTVRS